MTTHYSHPTIIFITSMESVQFTNTSDGESECSLRFDASCMAKEFSITPKDACVLKGHVEEFQSADTETQNRILETAMGELYALRPPGSTFDKKVAKRVSCPIILRWTTNRQ